MLLPTLFFLALWAWASTVHSSTNLAHQRKLCFQRCQRLLQRSLGRVDQKLNVEEVVQRIGVHRKEQLLAGIQQQQRTRKAKSDPAAEQFKAICWKFFDFEDCSRQCERAFFRRRRRTKDSPKNRGIGVEQGSVLRFCHGNDFGIPYDRFACVHKYHAFVEIRCSSYQQKAVELRLLALQLRQPELDAEQFGGKAQLGQIIAAVDQEACLVLHHHSSCLANALSRHCPLSRSLFSTRHSLRDNFLSFVLPFGTAMDRREGQESAKVENGAILGGPIELDPLFSDAMLDTCQLMDFKRMAEEWGERTAEANSVAMDRAKSTTKRWTAREEEEGEVTAAPSERRVFSSEEDLLDVPPNFHYSTARLPTDFYTRYAIWWGGRRKAQPSPVVKLLPETPKAESEPTKWPHQSPPTPMAMRETQPDPMPTQQARIRWEESADTRTTLPYIVNGQVTEPQERWKAEEEAEEMGRRRTEVRLIGDQQEEEDELRRRTTHPSNSWPHNVPIEDPWARALPRDEDSEENSVEEIIRQMDEQKWPKPTEGTQSQETANLKAQTTTNPNLYSTMNLPANEGNLESAKLREQQQTTTRNLDSTPMLRDTNVYFAKILEFDEEESEEIESPRQGAPRSLDMASSTRTAEPAIVAQMVHYPWEQLRPVTRQKDTEGSVEPEEAEPDGEEQYYEGEEDTTESPYEIRTANSEEWMTVGTVDLSQKTRVPSTPGLASSTPKILVSAEPVPPAHSDTLLVLLGLYLTFFGLAAFLLLCLVLACVERRRRTVWWTGRGWDKGRAKQKARAGSAILILDERKGTVKSVR